MYYEPDLKSFNESKNGQLYLKLNDINAKIGLLVSLLDNFTNIKIQLVEIIKDIDIIANDIKNDTTNFDIRRKSLLSNWIKDIDITKLLPLGSKQACLALLLSFEVDILLKELNDDYKEYMYNVSCYLKQVFKEINELKGVSVER